MYGFLNINVNIFEELCCYIFLHLLQLQTKSGSFKLTVLDTKWVPTKMTAFFHGFLQCMPANASVSCYDDCQIINIFPFRL